MPESIDATEFRPLSVREHVSYVPRGERAPRLWVRAAIAALIAVGFPATVWAGVGQYGHASDIPACATEDSVTDCYWDAETRGDGTGRSFEVRDGVVYFSDGSARVIPASELEGVTR